MHSSIRLLPALLCVTVVTTTATGSLWAQQDPVFSGPQKGERLADFQLLGVFDDEAGQKFDYLTLAGDKPTLLVFVHELTRPSIAVTRTLMEFAGKHKEKMYSNIVFLGDDTTALEERLKRARHAMPKGTPVHIAADGQEGPGAYGLNRNVTLTILLSKDRKVTANFALVQPSVQADVPKVIKEIVAITGGPLPSLSELGVRGAMAARSQQAGGSVDMRSLLGPVIRKNATPEQVEEAAQKAEATLAKNPAAAREVGAIARRIIDAGKLKNYGSPAAQKYLEQWAKKYQPPARPKRKKK